MYVYLCTYYSSQVDGPELPSLKHLESAGKHLGALLRIHHPPPERRWRLLRIVHEDNNNYVYNGFASVNILLHFSFTFPIRIQSAFRLAGIYSYVYVWNTIEDDSIVPLDGSSSGRSTTRDKATPKSAAVSSASFRLDIIVVLVLILGSRNSARIHFFFFFFVSSLSCCHISITQLGKRSFPNKDNRKINFSIKS